ncbi:type II toxin-antitoxin system death-on-curing family toxin [Patescibacteria group bacterium]|nr:type II toxin-antitoxin system death-on-curing family toxin [Patescibacteria group bacterium]
MRYLSLEEVIFLHEAVISKTGGSFGLRSLSGLISAIERPKAVFAGKDLYQTIFLKAAALFHSLVLNHPFVDGNKRIAIISTVRFLKINQVVLKVNGKELIEISLRVENKKLNLNQLASRIRRRSIMRNRGKK